MAKDGREDAERSLPADSNGLKRRDRACSAYALRLLGAKGAGRVPSATTGRYWVENRPQRPERCMYRLPASGRRKNGPVQPFIRGHHLAGVKFSGRAACACFAHLRSELFVLEEPEQSLRKRLGSSGGTRKPVSPWRTTSRNPPTELATTGRPPWPRGPQRRALPGGTGGRRRHRRPEDRPCPAGARGSGRDP
jgi:hypothetical protein